MTRKDDLITNCYDYDVVVAKLERAKREEREWHDQRKEGIRRKLSAHRQGIPLSEWMGYTTGKKYCTKFDEDCREHNRDKYGRRCFVCDKDEIDNGRRLAVHHVDMNKDQGCNDHVWSLVPLCSACHGKAHNPTWQSRIEYLLSSDKQ